MSFCVPGINFCEKHMKRIDLINGCEECEKERNKKRIITNSEKMETMNIEDKAIFLHDFYTTHTHITVNDFKEWLSAEYKEPIKLTIEEYIILKNIDKKYFNYIARNKNGSLYLYFSKPNKNNDAGIWKELSYMHCEDFYMFKNLFQFITWDDSEPYNIEELLKGVNYEVLCKRP